MGSHVEAVPERWTKRPLTTTIDLLASEYGWTDDYILDRTWAANRQSRIAILERLSEDHKNRLRSREIELQVMCSLLAPSKEQAKAAQAIRLFNRDATDQLAEMRPGGFEQLESLMGEARG